MPDSTYQKLNGFQRTALSWDGLMPYNAAHAVSFNGRPDLERLEGALRRCVESYGLGGFQIDPARRRFRFTGEAHVLLEVMLDRADTLEAMREKIETELNARFDANGPFMPVRFFALPHPRGFYLGAVYFHALADASSIAYFLNDVVRCYENGVPPVRANSQRHPRVRLRAARIAARIPAWLSTLPRDVADVRSSLRITSPASGPKRIGLFLARSEAAVESLALKSKALGVTLNDLFLASLLKAVPEPAHAGTNRRDRVSVGSIVSTRRDMDLNGGKEFGVYLSSFRVSSPSPQKIDLAQLAVQVRDQTERIKRQKLYLRNIFETAVAVRLQRFYDPSHRERFYAKHYPLSGGLTNVDLKQLWQNATLPDYWRAVSTSPAVPLVVSVTSAGAGLNLGLSFSENIYSRGQAQQVLERFQAVLSEALR